MAQATIKGYCAALLPLLVALYAADHHTAVGQQTTDPHNAAKYNELQISHIVIAEQLTSMMESLSMLQQENAELSQYIGRRQADTDTVLEARFELLKSGLNELRGECADMKRDVRADIADVRTHLRQISAGNSNNETTTRFKQLKQGQTQLETELKATLMDVKQHILQQVNATTESSSSRRQFEQCSNKTKPRDCGDILILGLTSSGTYTVYAGSTWRPLLVYCDMTTDNGGWTVLQRRQDGSENFQRNWVDYTSGFGDLYREFWLGNDNIYSLSTNGKRYKLRIDLADFNSNIRYAEYSDFKLGAPWEKYKLISVGTYSGNAGDSLSGEGRHVGSFFSTPDQDNDSCGTEQCAVLYKGGWWYDCCHRSNLNGYYYNGSHNSYADGVEWFHWTGYHYSLRFTEMKIRQITH